MINALILASNGFSFAEPPLAWVLVALLLVVALGVWRIDSRTRKNSERINEVEVRQDKIEDEVQELPDKVHDKVGHYFKRMEERNDASSLKLEAQIRHLDSRIDRVFEGK